ncbi:MAG: hydroxymethylbilane synthase [Gammaproteobacteria bacterium]
MKIATRKSPLALYQANLVKNLIEKNAKDITCTLVPLTSEGDELKGPLDTHGGKGLFIGNLENALKTKQADIAVHSLKDVPAVLSDEFFIAATLAREDPREVFLSREGFSLTDDMPLIIGSSSPRRKAQLLNINPEHKVVPIRGNIDSRIKTITTQSLDGIMIASAALKRLGITHQGHTLEISEMIPSASQGAIGIEVLESNMSSGLQKILSKINCEVTFEETKIERKFVERMQGDCNSPIGCYCRIEQSEILFSYQLLSLDGSKEVSNTIKLPFSNFDSWFNNEIDMLYQTGKQNIIYDH